MISHFTLLFLKSYPCVSEHSDSQALAAGFAAFFIAAFAIGYSMDPPY